MPSHNYNNRNVDRAPRKHSRRFGKASLNSFDRELDVFSKNLKRDFERALTRNFASWDPFQSAFGSGLVSHLLPQPEPLFHQPCIKSQPVRSFYERKTILNDDDGRTVVKTVKKCPGRPWETYVEEFRNKESIEHNKKPEVVEMNKDVEIVEEPIQNQASVEQSPSATEKNDATGEHNKDQQAIPHTTQNEEAVNTENSDNDMLSLFDREFRQLSDALTTSFDPFFGAPRSLLGSWDLWNREPLRFSPEQTSYRLRTIIDNNGDVTIKTATKDPGSEWQTSLRHYNREGGIEGNEKQEAIGEQQQQKSEKRESEQVSEAQPNNHEANSVRKDISH